MLLLSPFFLGHSRIIRPTALPSPIHIARHPYYQNPSNQPLPSSEKSTERHFLLKKGYFEVSSKKLSRTNSKTSEYEALHLSYIRFMSICYSEEKKSYFRAFPNFDNTGRPQYFAFLVTVQSFQKMLAK